MLGNGGAQIQLYHHLLISRKIQNTYLFGQRSLSKRFRCLLCMCSLEQFFSLGAGRESWDTGGLGCLEKWS